MYIKVDIFLGAYDGIGGVLKREAAKHSLRQPYDGQILTPEQFFNFCESRVPGIKCFFVSSKKIMENERKLKRRFAKAKSVKGTMQFHAVIAYDSNHAFFKQYSYSDIKQRKLVCD